MNEWRGATCAILASGPSLTPDDVARVHDWWSQNPETARAITINTTFRAAPWADILYACDARWWKVYHAEAKRVAAGEFWTIEHRDAPLGVRTIKAEPRPGLGRLPGVIHTGNNSGYQAINLAWQFGCSRVVLLGFDMQNASGRTHHHGAHPSSLNRANPYGLWLEKFRTLAADLRDDPMQVVNCSPVSALRCFPTGDLVSALRAQPVEVSA